MVGETVQGDIWKWLALRPPQLVGDGEGGGGEDEVEEDKEERHAGFPPLYWELCFGRALSRWKLYFYFDCRSISNSSWAGWTTLATTTPLISEQGLSLVEFRLFPHYTFSWIAFDSVGAGFHFIGLHLVFLGLCRLIDSMWIASFVEVVSRKIHRQRDLLMYVMLGSIYKCSWVAWRFSQTSIS